MVHPEHDHLTRLNQARWVYLLIALHPSFNISFCDQNPASRFFYEGQAADNEELQLLGHIWHISNRSCELHATLPPLRIYLMLLRYVKPRVNHCCYSGTPGKEGTLLGHADDVLS